MLKGRGAANAVYEYARDERQKIKEVIRVRARPAEGTADPLEAEVWSDLAAGAGDIASLEADVLYIQTVMAPLLGDQYIAEHVCCLNARVVVCVFSSTAPHTASPPLRPPWVLRKSCA